jgi:hypothetical protein
MLILFAQKAQHHMEKDNYSATRNSPEKKTQQLHAINTQLGAALNHYQ